MLHGTRTRFFVVFTLGIAGACFLAAASGTASATVSGHDGGHLSSGHDGGHRASGHDGGHRASGHDGGH